MIFAILSIFFGLQVMAQDLSGYRGSFETIVPDRPATVRDLAQNGYKESLTIVPRRLNEIEVTTTRQHNPLESGFQYQPITEKTRFRLNQTIIGRKYRTVNSSSYLIRDVNCTYVVTRMTLVEGTLRLESSIVHPRGCPSDKEVLANFVPVDPGAPIRTGSPRLYLSEYHLESGVLTEGRPEALNASIDNSERNQMNKDSVLPAARENVGSSTSQQ